MLDNEPEGGERNGATPASETADTTTTGQRADTTPAGTNLTAGTAPGGTDVPAAEATTPPTEAATPPVRRARATRRRTSPAAAEAAQAGAPVEAPAETTVVSGEAPDGDVLAPVAGDTESAPKTPRRRRKATTADKPEVPAAETLAPAAPVEPEAPAEAAPPVKVTRTRRRKAAAPVAEAAPLFDAAPAAEVTPVGNATPAGGATPVGGVTPEGEVAPGGEVAPAGGEVAPGAAVVGAPVQTPSPVVPAAEPVGPVGTEADPQAPPTEEEPPRTRRRRAAITPPTVLFMAPEPETPPVRITAEPPAAPAVTAPAEDEPVEEPTESSRRRRRGRRTAEPVAVEAEVTAPAATDEEADEDEDEDEESAARRRRRRGRRGRGRGKGTAEDEADDEETEPAVKAADAEPADGDDTDDDGAGDGVTRRRRRRRRKGAGDADGTADDGVPTVVKIREPRRGSSDEVQGVSGSTRLEAKRQRRRDGREQRRTRPPILSESEFLARREAVDRVMAVRQRGDRTQIAVLEDGVLVEHYVTRNSAGTMAGNVYLGKVQNVLPSMEAAFVDVGRGRNAVLYAGEVNWDTTGLEGRARSIEQALRSGDSVLVQVTKDPIGHKGARLTSHIALSGRHLVYVPHGNASGISRKLPDTERKRLRDVLKKLVPDGAGVIVRTAAEGASEDELARDVKRLQAQWEDIQAKAAGGGAPVLLYEEPDLVIRVVRDLFNEDFRELVVQGETSYEMVESYLSHVSPDLVARLRRHTGTTDVFAERRIDEQILKGLDRKVFLPSGGHLVIDRTEAMTVIDVNTGKYTGAGGNLEETVTRNNLEAAEEIVRQLRLRDIGGIVVIDFIDMVLESNRDLVLRRLTECLGRDRTKHQVTEITSLGLVQMTRKRIGAGLLEAFSETCDCCKGRGLIIHTEPVPEKPRASANGGAAEKVKAVASASTNGAAAVETTTSTGRRRGRRATTPEKATVEVVEVAGDDDTMGYDLSRYENAMATPDLDEAPELANGVDAEPTEPIRLAGADDPDALDENGDLDDEGEPAGAGGRRRSRRGTRRRTRP
jgi:ribonuclease E